VERAPRELPGERRGIVSRKEKIERLMENAKREIEAIGTEAMDEIRAAGDEATERESRYYEAAEQLEEVKADIAATTDEREQLPNQAYRAGLDERYEEEDRLKERYKNLGLALPALWERQDALEAEMAELLPNSRGHRLDAAIQTTTSIARVASHARKDLEHLKEGLTKALDAAVNPVVKEHTDLLAEAEARNAEREWDHPLAGRRAGY
jgi:hypothetical protein